MVGVYDIYTYYARNVGIVARETETAMFTWKSVLVDYDLK